MPSSEIGMGKFSPTKLNGNCEEIANPSTAYGRRRRNWIDAHRSIPSGQVIDASCGNERCIALRHASLRPRVEQPGKYRKIADRVHRMRVGQYFDVRGVGTDERSRNRFRSGLYAAAGLDRVSARAARRRRARHEGRGVVERGRIGKIECEASEVLRHLGGTHPKTDMRKTLRKQFLKNRLGIWV